MKNKESDGVKNEKIYPYNNNNGAADVRVADFGNDAA